MKIALSFTSDCLRGVEAVDSVRPSSGQGDQREIGQGDEFWKTFFSLVKRNFSFLRYCCMKIWYLEHWQLSCSHHGSKTSFQNARACQGEGWKTQILDCMLFCWVDSPETTCLRAAIIWDNKHLLFKLLLVRSSFTCRGKHLNWYRTLSIPCTKSVQKGSKKTDWWGSVVAHPLAQGMKKAAGSASFRLNWTKSPGLRFLHFSAVFPFVLASPSGSLPMVSLSSFRLSLLAVAVTVGEVASSPPTFHQKL